MVILTWGQKEYMMSLAIGVGPFSLKGNYDKHQPLSMKRCPTNEENQNHGHCKIVENKFL